MTRTFHSIAKFLICISLIPCSFIPLKAQLSVSTTHVNVTCNGGSDGSATAIPSGGTGRYSYMWTPYGGTNASAVGLDTGTYSVTLTDTEYGPRIDTLYLQTFEGTHLWTLNVPTGVNGADPNFWLVADDEGGVLPPGCGVANNSNKTLFITSVFNPTGGASYDAGGLCGILFCPQTSSRSESPAFSTLTHYNNLLEFDFISQGDGLNDNASVWYDNGTGWTVLSSSIKSTVCGSGQGRWTHYKTLLPPNCDNKANVRVGINWVNNDDGVGTDPSIAINNVVVTDSIFGSFTLQTTSTTVVISEPALITRSQSITLCDGQSISIGSNSYNTDGSYYDTLVAYNGCDSILNTNLSIQAPINTGTTVAGSTIRADENSATYQWIDCDNSNTAISGAFARTYNPTSNGNYAVVVTKNGCSDTSDCVDIKNVGMEGQELNSNILFYPNPSSDLLTIIIPIDLLGSSFSICDLQGKELIRDNMLHTQNILDVHWLSSGMYYLRIEGDGSTYKLVKQ